MKLLEVYSIINNHKQKFNKSIIKLGFWFKTHVCTLNLSSFLFWYHFLHSISIQFDSLFYAWFLDDASGMFQIRKFCRIRANYTKYIKWLLCAFFAFGRIFYDVFYLFTKKQLRLGLLLFKMTFIITWPFPIELEASDWAVLWEILIPDERSSKPIFP